jgi:hypothetical protein
MMKTLKIEEGSIIRVTGASLPKGKFVKLQAQETSFVEIANPKAVLEQVLIFFRFGLNCEANIGSGSTKLYLSDARRHHRDHL